MGALVSICCTVLFFIKVYKVELTFFKILDARRCTGTITGVGVADPKDWADSLWRSVKVDWDESAASERHERVSPWEIEPFVPVSTLPPPPSVGPRQPKRRPPTLVTDSSPLGVYV